MALFTAMSSVYDNDVQRIIKSRMDNCYTQSITTNQVFWSQADTAWRFYSGDQTLWNDMYGNIPSNNYMQFSFNRIRRIVNMVSGHQRRTRKSLIVIPIENADNKTADQFTKVLMWAMNKESMLETMSEAFEGALVGGMNLLHMWIDYRRDPVSGDLKLDNLSYNSFLIDPFFRKLDLSDCNYIWKRSFLTKREVISLMPDKEEIILSLVNMNSGTGRDGKFQMMPESYNFGVKNLLTYDEFYYKDYRKQKMLVDTETGEVMEWKSQNNEGLKQFLNLYPQITMTEQEVPTVRLAIVVQDCVLYDGPNPTGVDKFPFLPVVAYYAPQIAYLPYRVQGMVQGLQDAQYLYNRRKILELKIFESQVNSGYVYKEDALVDPNSVFLSGEGRGIALKSSAAMTDIQKIEAPSVPQSMIEISKILAQEIEEVSGVNSELLGSSQDDMAGVLSMLRQSSGITTLQGLFDRFDATCKMVGNLAIDMIQANFTPGKVFKILQTEEPSQQFYNKDFGVYHAMVVDGFLTDTQKQLQLQQMIQLRELGVPIPSSELLHAATLQNKDRIIKAIEESELQQQQMQEMQAKMAMAVQQSDIKLSDARAHADVGLFAERTSRVEQNKASAVERLHRANAEDDKALLDKIRAIKEFEKMDTLRAVQLVELMNSLKEQESAVAEIEVGKVSEALS